MPRLCCLLVLLALASGCKAPPVGLPDDADAPQDGKDLSDATEVDAFDTAGFDGAIATLDVEVESGATAEVDTTPDLSGELPSDDGSTPVDAVDVDATPTGYCASLELPKPGDLCTQEGAANCTNAGATSEFKNQAYNHGYCRRPNRVVCTNGIDGFRWKMEACPIPPPECIDAGQIVTCQVNERGGKCCPLKYKAGSSSSFGEVCSELPSDLSAKWCDGHLKKCAFPDVYLSETPTSLQAGATKALEKCLPWCKDCVYSMGFAQTCPSLSMYTCGFAQQPYEKAQQSQVNCFEGGLPGKPGPVCVETCEEYKLTEWYKDWFK